MTNIDYSSLTMEELFEELSAVAAAIEDKWGDDRPIPEELRISDVVEDEVLGWIKQDRFRICQGNGCNKIIWKTHEYCRECERLMEIEDGVA